MQLHGSHIIRCLDERTNPELRYESLQLYCSHSLNRAMGMCSTLSKECTEMEFLFADNGKACE
jgi:hypothetical protein